MDEQDVDTSLALSPFEAVTVTSQVNRYLVGFLNVVYEWAFFAVCGTSGKLRRFENRKEQTEQKIQYFLTNLAMEFRSCKNLLLM